MFGFERLWGRLVKWMTQKSHPEATMLNAFRAFTKACIALPEQMSLLQVSMTEPSQAFGSQTTPFYHVPQTFNTDTFELSMPFFMKNLPPDSDIDFLDFKGRVRLRTDKRTKGDSVRWLAELHLYYLNFPEQCRQCQCSPSLQCACPNYAQLWDQFLEETGTVQPSSKRRLPTLLDNWHSWAQQQKEQGRLSAHQVSVCSGPLQSVDHFERARHGSAVFVTNRLEGAKQARDSVVMSRDGPTVTAGRVKAFLAHVPPGVQMNRANEVYIADVQWYAQVPASHVAAQKSSKILGCPIFKKTIHDHSGGNFWPVSKIAQCKLCALPHHSGSNHLVILSRFSSFVKLV